MLFEPDLIPYKVTSPVGERSIILAPHPDDETIGCGGTIRLLLNAKKSVKVIFLTSGDKADPSHKLSHIVNKKNPPIPPFLKGGKGGLHKIPPDQNHVTHYALLREKEAINALNVLGISEYEFLRFPDRRLHEHYHEAADRLLRIFTAYRPDAVYSPSMIELNPDHRTTAVLALEIQRIVMNTDINTLIYDDPPPLPPPQGGRVRVGVMPIRLVFYEVTTPLRPNMLVDITSTYRWKKKAIKKYASQLKLMDYLKYITALNVFRALTADGASCVEAFWCAEKPLSDEDVTSWLTYQKKV